MAIVEVSTGDQIWLSDAPRDTEPWEVLDIAVTMDERGYVVGARFKVADYRGQNERIVYPELVKLAS